MHTLRADVRIKSQTRFFGQSSYSGRLACITTDESEQLLQEIRIPLPASFTQAQIMLNDALNDRLIEMLRQIRKRSVFVLVNDGVASTLREVVKYMCPELGMGEPIRAQSDPKFLRLQGVQSIFLQKRRGRWQAAQCPDLGQGEHAHFQGIDASREAVAPQFNAQGRTARNDGFDRSVIHQRLELHVPILEILDFVKKQICHFPALRQGIEPLGGNMPFKPVCNTQNGFR